MSTQGDRQDFFPPNDNSVQTNLKYDLFAEKMYKSFKSVEMKHKKTSLSDTIGVLNLVVSLVGSLIVLIVLSLIELIKWLRS